MSVSTDREFPNRRAHDDQRQGHADAEPLELQGMHTPTPDVQVRVLTWSRACPSPASCNVLSVKRLPAAVNFMLWYRVSVVASFLCLSSSYPHAQPSLLLHSTACWEASLDPTAGRMLS